LALITARLLTQVFNFKLDSFASYQHKCAVLVQPLLKLKARPRVSPVNRSLSVHGLTFSCQGQKQTFLSLYLQT
jgi:hypothetical protein